MFFLTKKTENPSSVIKTDRLSRASVWVHCEEPSDFEITQLVEMLHIQKDLLKDALDIHEVPRLEIEDDVPHIFIRYPTREKGDLVTQPLLCILFQDQLVTFSRFPLPQYEKVRERIVSGRVGGAMEIFTVLLAEIDVSFNAALTLVSKDIRKYQRKEEAIKNNDILRFVHVENILQDLHGALLRMEAIYDGLLSKRHFTLSESQRDQIEDIKLETQQMMELLKVNIRTITNTRDAYTIILTNNLNRIIKMFTSVTVILTIPVLVASFYGMNVNLPFQEHAYAFFGIVVACSAISIVLITIFIHNDWV